MTVTNPFLARHARLIRAQALSLSYSLKKYAGLQSYVLPYDSRHSDFRPDVGLAGAEAIFAAAMADVASFAAASAAAAKARNSNRSKLASRGRPFPDRREFTKRMRGRGEGMAWIGATIDGGGGW